VKLVVHESTEQLRLIRLGIDDVIAAGGLKCEPEFVESSEFRVEVELAPPVEE